MVLWTWLLRYADPPEKLQLKKQIPTYRQAGILKLNPVGIKPCKCLCQRHPS